MLWFTRLSKLAATSSSSVFKNLITTQNHPISSTLSKQKHSFSNHLVGYKSPPLIISSKYGQYYPNNVFMVKHYNTYGSSYQGQEWRRLACSKTHFVFFVGYFVIPFGTMLYIAYSQTIPYTNRTHFVLLPPSEENFLAEIMFEKDKLGVLPEEHPDSVRVKSIGDKIVKALESDLKAMKGKKLTVGHLVDVKWEFLVVKNTNRVHLSSSVPGGKIFVSSDLLNHLESDAEIATFIGHEVGHVVARHGPRRLNMLVLTILANKHLGLDISLSKMTEHIPDGLRELGRVLFSYPRRRREEMEADYIGLLLMASAGFDPQEAPNVYATLDQFLPSSSKSDLYKTHPSRKKRAKALVKVMEEANSIYSKTIGSSWKKEDS